MTQLAAPTGWCGWRMPGHECVLADEIVSHAFSHGFRDDHLAPLAAYWGEALGGPDTSSPHHGQRDRRSCACTAATARTRRWTAAPCFCFDEALTDVGLTEEPLRGVLHDYFAWAMRSRMSAFHGSQDQGLTA